MAERTAQQFRQDKTDAEHAIATILRTLEDNYPGFTIQSLEAWRQTLTGPDYLKLNAQIKFEIVNFVNPTK